MRKFQFALSRRAKWVLFGGLPGMVAAASATLLIAQTQTASLSSANGGPSSTVSTAPSVSPTSTVAISPTTTVVPTSTPPCSATQLAILNQSTLMGQGAGQAIMVYPLINTSKTTCTVGGGMPTVLGLYSASSAAALSTLSPSLASPPNLHSSLNPSGVPNTYNLPTPLLSIAPGQEMGVWEKLGTVFAPNVPTVSKSSSNYASWQAQQSATPDSCAVLFAIPVPESRVAVPLDFPCGDVAAPIQSSITGTFPITPGLALTNAMASALGINN